MFRPNTGRGFNRGINVAFISIRCSIWQQQQRHEPTSCHAIFAFMIPTLLNFLELQCQGNGTTASPFQTHPKTMRIALVILFLYCLAYGVELGRSPLRHPPLARCYAEIIHGGMAFLGSLLAVSLASVLFQDHFVGLVLYFLYVLFSNGNMLWCGLKVLSN